MARQRFSGPKYANGNHKSQQTAYNQPNTAVKSVYGLMQKTGKLNVTVQVKKVMAKTMLITQDQKLDHAS